ncbi:MAG: hypothetical protein ACI3ZY_07570, partial [Parabacteroides sp.]
NHILLGLILLCVMAACHRRPAMDFAAIEAIMPAQPDSALAMLDTLHTDPNDFSAKDRAHYYLLLTEAMDKCYLTHTTDSLITIAKDYYENANDPNRRAKAWYYMGLIREEDQQPLLAQDAYLEALREEERVDDHALLGRVNNRLGMLYTWQMVHERANFYQRKAIEHLKAVGDSSAVQLAYRDLGRNLTLLDSLEQAIGCYQSALSFSAQRRMLSVPTELAALYLKTGKHSEARHCLEEANKQAAIKKPAYSLWLVWGEYYMAIRQADSARYYLQRCLESPHTHPAATHHLARLADQTGDLAASVHYYKQYDALRDSAYLRKQADLMRTAAADQEHQEIKEKMFCLEIALRDQKVYVLIITVIALISLIAFLLVKLRLSQRNAEIKKQQTLLKELESNYGRLKKRLISNQEVIELLRTQSDVNNEKLRLQQERICQLEKENQQINQELEHGAELERELFCSEVYRRFLDKKFERSRLSSADWNDLVMRLDNCYDNFSHRILQLEGLSDKEVRICYLVKAKIPPSRIGDLLGCTTTSVSMTRSRLYSKIMKQKGSAEQFDRFILDF